MLTLPEICRDRYLLHHALRDCGFPPGRAALAVEVLLGPEPEEPQFEPTEEDWLDYCQWSDRLDYRDAIRPDDCEYISDRDVMVATGCVG